MITRNITVCNDPSFSFGKKTYQVNDGDNLLDWLIEYCSSGGIDVDRLSVLSGEIGSHELDIRDYEQVNIPIRSNIFIVNRPHGLDPITIQIIIAVVAALAATLLVPTPNIPGLGKSQRRSPNNALSGQENIARALDRIPSIFGKVLSVPDLISSTSSEYIDHVLFQDEHVCVGEGFYLIQDVRTGDTLINNIEGSSFTVYDPGQAPDSILKTVQSNEVSSQEIRAPNDQPQAQPDETFSLVYTAIGDFAVITSPDPSNNVWADILPGDTVEVTLSAEDAAMVVRNLGGTYIVGTVNDTDLELTNAASINANWAFFDAAPSSPSTEGLIKVADQIKNVGYFVVPGDQNSQIWYDFVAQKGLAQGSGLNNTLNIDMEVDFQLVDSEDLPIAPVITIAHTLSGRTIDQRAWTFKFTEAEGMILSGRYLARVRRLTDILIPTGESVEEIRWTRLAGIRDVSGPDTTGTTRLFIQTSATPQVAALQDNRFNLQATRKTVTWDGSNVIGNIETGEGLTPSRRMADAFLHYCLDPKLAARSISQIDVESIYDIQDSLDAVFDGEKGEFSYTFDDKDTPAIEELRVIALSCRCFVTRTGGVFSMTRDQSQPLRRGQFGRRNKLPDAETTTYSYNTPLGKDGVKLEYSDIETDNTLTINLPADLIEGDPNYGAPASLNPLSVDAIGIRNYSQAWDRAQFEYNRIIHRRKTVQSVVSMDGLLLNLNDRISHTDASRYVNGQSDGEIKAVNGLTITTSERCVFEPMVDYSVIVRGDFGDVFGPIPVTARSDTQFGFILSSSIPITVRGDNGAQRGSLYNFAPDTNALDEDCLVQRIAPDAEGNISLELINYTESYYQADNVTPPPKG